MMTTRDWLIPGLLLMSAGCDGFPADPEATSAHVEAARILRVGVTSDAAGQVAAGQLLARLSSQTQARAAVDRGDLEPMLLKLEGGTLELVIAWFDEDTPWRDRVALAPALEAQTRNGHRMELRAAARNGENRWMMTVETASRASAADGAR